MAPKWFFLLLGLSLAAGCVTEKIAVKPALEISRIRRITVMPFEGEGGAEATDDIIRELVRTGVEVTDAKHMGDVILKGTMTDYKSSNQLMVFLGNTTLMASGGQTIVVDNPVVSLAGAQAVPETVAHGGRRAQIASIIATVGMNARLTDASGKTVLWAGSMAYEGLDLQDTLRQVSERMVVSMATVVPQMRKRPS